jgi:hypothetical protein
MRRAGDLHNLPIVGLWMVALLPPAAKSWRTMKFQTRAQAQGFADKLPFGYRFVVGTIEERLA